MRVHKAVIGLVVLQACNSHSGAQICSAVPHSCRERTESLLSFMPRTSYRARTFKVTFSIHSPSTFVGGAVYSIFMASVKLDMFLYSCLLLMSCMVHQGLILYMELETISRILVEARILFRPSSVFVNLWVS